MRNFWRTLEIPLINCEINLILTCSVKCVVVSTASGNQRAPFSKADTKILYPVITLSIEDNAKLLQQWKSGFRRAINWNKYQSKVSVERPKQYFNLTD